jgi:hypothetical protein
VVALYDVQELGDRLGDPRVVHLERFGAEALIPGRATAGVFGLVTSHEQWCTRFEERVPWVPWSPATGCRRWP